MSRTPIEDKEIRGITPKIIRWVAGSAFVTISVVISTCMSIKETLYEQQLQINQLEKRISRLESKTFGSINKYIPQYPANVKEEDPLAYLDPPSDGR